jgi:hypothetical protein
VWETAYNYTKHREIFRCDFGPRNGAENINDTDGCFELFLIKKSQQILEKYAGMQNNIRRRTAVFLISIICEIMDACEDK